MSPSRTTPTGSSSSRPLQIAGDGPLSVEAEVAPRGAALRSLTLTASSGARVNVVLGHREAADYGRLPGYLGVTVGRYANRIDGGRFTLDGREVQVEPNEGPHALHGGAQGWDTRDWELIALLPHEIRLGLTSPDGDQGFPGTVRAEARYAVVDDTVVVEYSATTDVPTVVSIANHAYFNLAGEGSGPVDDQVLTVLADGYTPVGEDLIPTGAVRDVTGSPLDWREPVRLGDRITTPQGDLVEPRGLDHNFVLRDSATPNGVREAASLQSAVTGVHLQLSTDQPGLQVYTGQYLDGTLVGTSGTAYGPRGGIALETQQFPDAPNQPGFPPVVLRPGERYSATTRLRFSHHGE